MNKIFCVIIGISIVILSIFAFVGCAGPDFIDVIKKVYYATAMEIDVSIEVDDGESKTEVLNMILKGKETKDDEIFYSKASVENSNTESYLINDKTFTYINKNLIDIEDYEEDHFTVQDEGNLMNLIVFDFSNIKYEVTKEKEKNNRTAYIVDIDRDSVIDITSELMSGYFMELEVKYIVKNSTGMPESMYIEISKNGVTVTCKATYNNINKHKKIDIDIPEELNNIKPEEYGLMYNLNESKTEYTVTGYNNCYNNVVIPSTYNGKPVTAIGEHAFAQATKVKTVTLPDSITEIGNQAFSNVYNTNIDKITLSRNLTTIGECAFQDSFAEIVFPESCVIEEIGQSAFYQYHGDAIELPDGVNKICAYAFYDFLGSTIKLPNGLTVIEDHAFENSSIQRITIPANVNYLGKYAFSACYHLEEINILSENITELKENTFYACYCLIRMNSEENIININNTITTLENNVFNSCNAITEINLPSNLTEIPDSCFYECANLLDITIPDTVTTIGSDAFAVCGSLSSITIPDNVTEIGSYAFYGCSGLESVVFSENSSLSALSEGAFSDCINLTDLNLPDSVTELGERIFYNCESLTSFTIPINVATISYQAFEGCYFLAEISVAPNNNYFFSDEGVLYKKSPMILLYYPPKKTTENYNVLEGTVEIYQQVFSYNQYLKKIVLPQSITRIGNYSLGNYSLEEVTILALIPPSYNFSLFNKLWVKIYVYENVLNDYKAAWPNYQNNLFAITE